MNLYENEQYIEDVKYVGNLDLPWEKLQDKSIMLSGATGLIGSFLIDTLMFKPEINCKIYAVSRDVEKIKNRFIKWIDAKRLCFVLYDVNRTFGRDDIQTTDYVLHLASNTHPMQKVAVSGP